MRSKILRGYILAQPMRSKILRGGVLWLVLAWQQRGGVGPPRAPAAWGPRWCWSERWGCSAPPYRGWGGGGSPLIKGQFMGILFAIYILVLNFQQPLISGNMMKYLQYFHIPEKFCLIFHTHRTMKKIYCLWMIFLQTSYSISLFLFLSQFKTWKRKKRLKIHIRDIFLNS